MKFKLTIEPTPELYDAPINGVKVPVRVWKGFTETGLPVEAYVLSITPRPEGLEQLKAELPPFMVPSREMYEIDQTAGYERKLISLNEAAAAGIERVRKPVWAAPEEHLKIDIINGKPGPQVYLYAPFNARSSGRDPVSVTCSGPDYDAKWLVPYTGPLPDSPEYRAAVERFRKL